MKNFVNGIAFTIAIMLTVVLIFNSVELDNCNEIINGVCNLYEYNTAIETINRCAANVFMCLGSMMILAGVWTIFTAYVRDKES